MTRRIICLLLAMVLFSGLLPQPIAKAQSLEENPVNQFCYHDLDMEALFCSDAHIIYWNLVNDIEADTAFATSLEIASWVIGESVSEERCTEVLANLLVMQQGNIASQIESQGEYDNLKGWKDYVEDAVSIASDYLGATGKLSTFAPAVETLSDGIDLIEGNISQAKYYKAIVADYCYSKEVLQAVIDHCKSNALRSAAAEISRGRDELLLKQLDCLTNELGNVVKFEGKFFLKQMFFPLMKETNSYMKSVDYKKFVDGGEAFVNTLLQTKSTFKAAFQITMLAGDLGFGTTNTYRRYQEMRILSDIAVSLSKELFQTNIPQNSTDAKTVQAVAKKCSLYKMLLTTHIRGEYLVYQLLTQDAGLLSQYRRRVDYSKSPEKTTEGVYNSQVQTIQKYYDMIESILLQLQIPVSPSASTDLTPNVFNEIPETFISITSSIRTNWNISIKPDGSFISTVKIPDWGDNTPDYPLGTSRVTETQGQFTNFEKVSEYSYKMIAAQVENIGPFGKAYISDDVRYIVTDTAYIKAGDEYYLYLPGTPYSELPQGLIDSVNNNGRHSMDEITSDTFVLYRASLGSNGYDSVYIGKLSNTPAKTDEDVTIAEKADSTMIPGFYKQTDNELNTLAIHEVNGNKMIFTIFWYRIWDISKAEATLNGNVASFDYASPNYESLHAKGTIDVQDDTAILTLTECTQTYVDTGEYRFKLVGIKFTDEQLKEISYALGVPMNLDTQITQGEPIYWEGGDMYRTSIEVYCNGEFIAGASVNSLTGDLAGNIYLCQIAADHSEGNFDVASTFGFTKAWDIHDRSGTDHYVTSLAFHDDGTFSCCTGWYRSELFAAFTGTYQVSGNELLLHYTLDGQQKNVAYQVDWKNHLFRQVSEENLVIPHQIGSEYPFEESTEYSAEDRANHVRLFIQRGGQPLGD